MRFSLAVTNTPWIPERLASRLELEKALAPLPSDCVYKLFDEKAPNHVWSEQMWDWAAAQDVDWCIFLQDDTEVSPFFWERIKALCAIADDEGRFLLGLHVVHPAGRALLDEGCPGFTTADALVGVGYAVDPVWLKEFLKWRKEALKEGAVEAISEDSLIGLFAMYDGETVYHPLPALVDHNTSIPSTYANDAHPNRRSSVRWNTERVDWEGWENGCVSHLGRFYDASPQLLQHWLKEPPTPDMMQAWVSDNGLDERRRIHYARLGRGEPPAFKLLIATPTRGSVHPAYCRSIWQLLRDETLSVSGDLEVCDVQMWQSDVVRVRNRFAHMFLHETDATHLLFLDDDVEVLPLAIRGMLGANKGFIAAPYPKRDSIDWTAVGDKEDPLTPPEARAYRYSVRPLKDEFNITDKGICEVAAMPLGCALISREALRFVSERTPETYVDIRPNGARVSVKNLFGLMTVLDEGGAGLLSEDYSFCARWRLAGEKVWMYLGDGAPVTHHGQHAYRGHIEAFGLRRG